VVVRPPTCFSVGGSETVRFILPSAQSAILNRVTGDQASMINGQITSNGRVYLLNPNGILIGPNGRINTAGVVLSTLDINDDDFIDGRSATLRGSSNNAVVNQGIITTTLGDVALIARRVVNEGVIDAPNGTVALAGAGEVVLHPEGASERVSIIASSGTVVNAGAIRAVAAELQAVGGNAYALAINNTGVVRAQTVEHRAGRVLLRARGSTFGQANIANSGQLIADGGSVSLQATGTNPTVISTGVIATQTAPDGARGSIELLATNGQGQTAGFTAVSGVLDASGRNPGQRGGNITVTGGNVALLDGTLIDASGSDGLSRTTAGRAVSDHRPGSAGGDIRIGGDYLGGGDTPTAANLYVAPGVLVLNDALNTGDAGRTIFWSDNTTRFYGNVYARALGGRQANAQTGNATPGGNAGEGGFVETSGHVHLDAGGYVDLTASAGERGTYFLRLSPVPGGLSASGTTGPATATTPPRRSGPAPPPAHAPSTGSTSLTSTGRAM